MKSLSSLLTLKNILIGFVLLLLDAVLHIFLGIYLMKYDDFYDESEGEYWSLASMEVDEKIAYIALNVSGILNVIAIVYIIYRIIIYFKRRKNTNLQYLDYPKDTSEY